MFTEKIIGSIIVTMAGVGLTIARRYRNENDSHAGIGTAGWTIIILLFMWA